jgi:hypothetical protein
MQSRNYIVFQWGEPRKMLVFNGVPYYRSTGHNSTYANIWFPFMLMRGTRPVNINGLPSNLYKDRYENSKETFPVYIVKLDAGYFNPTPMLFTGVHPADEPLALRLPTKETIVTSVRLSGDYFPQDKLALVSLSAEEQKLTKEPILLAKDPIFTTSDPDKINDWLINQGATIARALLPDITQKFLEQKIQVIETSTQPEVTVVQDIPSCTVSTLVSEINKLGADYFDEHMKEVFFPKSKKIAAKLRDYTLPDNIDAGSGVQQYIVNSFDRILKDISEMMASSKRPKGCKWLATRLVKICDQHWERSSSTNQNHALTSVEAQKIFDGFRKLLAENNRADFYASSAAVNKSQFFQMPKLHIQAQPEMATAPCLQQKKYDR